MFVLLPREDVSTLPLFYSNNRFKRNKKGRKEELVDLVLGFVARKLLFFAFLDSLSRYIFSLQSSLSLVPWILYVARNVSWSIQDMRTSSTNSYVS